MTRKDYVLIAQAIKLAKEAYSPHGFSMQVIGIKTAAAAVAVKLQQDNPRFDRERFMRACGFED